MRGMDVFCGVWADAGESFESCVQIFLKQQEFLYLSQFYLLFRITGSRFLLSFFQFLEPRKMLVNTSSCLMCTDNKPFPFTTFEMLQYLIWLEKFQCPALPFNFHSSGLPWGSCVVFLLGFPEMDSGAGTVCVLGRGWSPAARSSLGWGVFGVWLLCLCSLHYVGIWR